MDEAKQEKVPIDAKLLSEAIIELNISRRSVGLYPPEHPIIKESIKRAYDYLQKLFELRSSITLGIANDTLIIDEYTLERKNPVFQEIARSLHSKDIAAITFYAGLEPEELVVFHELITMREEHIFGAIIELAAKKGLRHIALSPIDLSSFTFIEGQLKQGVPESRLWEDYVYGLLEGKLADKEAEGIVLRIQPQQMAAIINELMPEDSPDEKYERVITTYLRGKEKYGLSRELMEKFRVFLENLNPSVKVQFLKRALSLHPSEIGEMDNILDGLKEDDLQKIMEAFRDKAPSIPESLKNLIDKLAEAKQGGGFILGVMKNGNAILDDIEIDENILKLIDEDHFKTFVGEGYQRDIEKMLKGIELQKGPMAEAIKDETNEGVIDRSLIDVIIELLETNYLSREDYLQLLTRLSELVDIFLQTGRFQEVCEIYNVIYTHSLTGRFKEEASSMLEYFFRAPLFISNLVSALKLWGRYDREGALRLTWVLRLYMINYLIDALAERHDSTTRKFFLQLLSNMGSDVLPEAVRRLQDSRWYIVRNMIYLIRECRGGKYVKQIRNFARDKNKKVCIEAVKTLLHFKTPDALSYLKLYLRGDDPELREQAVMLSGMYKIKETVPYLIELLEKKDLLGTESYYKISAVKALSQIGDTRAIEPLTKVYNSKTLLFHGSMNELRLEIFRNLDGYPAKVIKPLIVMGIRSKNEAIRALCEKYVDMAQTIDKKKNV